MSKNCTKITCIHSLLHFVAWYFLFQYLWYYFFIVNCKHIEDSISTKHGWNSKHVHECYCPRMITWAFVYITKTNNNAKNRLGRSIKNEIKTTSYIYLVSAVGRASVSVICFTRTGRSSTTGKTLLFYLRKQSIVQKTSLTGFFIHTWIWDRIFYLNTDKYKKKIE
jgi:hypothetical protein